MKRIGVGLAVAVIALTGATAYGDGTETLGAPSIVLADGSGFVIGGVGLLQPPHVGDISIDVPAGATVEQVLLYWSGLWGEDTGFTDNTATVDGNGVTGTLIGGPTVLPGTDAGNGDLNVDSYRADITGLGLIGPGANLVTVEDIEYSDFTLGAGLVVVIDDGSGSSLALADGSDFVFIDFPAPLNATVPVTFSFPSSDFDRVAHIPIHVGSQGEEGRPNCTRITTNGPNGDTDVLPNLFEDDEGEEWDSLVITVTIPAQSTELTIQLFSEDCGGTGGLPASLNWVAAGLDIDDLPEPGECDGKVTCLTLQYNGTEEALVQVNQMIQGNRNRGFAFDGIVQPGEQFSFCGLDKHGTLGPEIDIFVDGECDSVLHTSCSQPIGPGVETLNGLFTVVAGESRNGGSLPSFPSGTTQDVREFCHPGTNGNGMLSQHTMSVTINDVPVESPGHVTQGSSVSSESAPASSIAHGSGFAVRSVTDEAPAKIAEGSTTAEAPATRIAEALPEATDDAVIALRLAYLGVEPDAQVVVLREAPNATDGWIDAFSGIVQSGEEFDVTAETGSGLGRYLYVFVNGDFHALIDTEDPEAFGTGLIFGDMEIVAGTVRNGGVTSPLASAIL